MGLRDKLNNLTSAAASAVGSMGGDSPPATSEPPSPSGAAPDQAAPAAGTSGALEPIAGISLERYAELAAKMADCDGDLEVCARIAGENGVDRPTWEAAMAGWNARMNDPATAAEVALAYMPLYQAALAEHGGPRATATEDEYLEMLAMINTDLKEGDVRPVPFEPMYERFGINAPKWSQISTDWVETLSARTPSWRRVRRPVRRPHQGARRALALDPHPALVLSGTRRRYLISGSRGRPRMRSPIWLRLISEVPPAIDMARCMSTRMPVMAPGPSMKAASGPVSSVEDGGGLVAELGQHQLGDGALGPGSAAGDGAVGAAQVQQRPSPGASAM